MALNQPRPENLPPDWRAVRFDETQYWNSKFLDEHGVEKMCGVYLVDFSSRTYCCSLTPSYAMFFVESVPVGGPDDERQRDFFEDEVRTADSHTQPVSYMTCSNVDDHIKNEDNFDKIELDGDDWWKEDPRDDGLDEVMEAYAGCPSW